MSMDSIAPSAAMGPEATATMRMADLQSQLQKPADWASQLHALKGSGTPQDLGTSAISTFENMHRAYRADAERSFSIREAEPAQADAATQHPGPAAEPVGVSFDRIAQHLETSARFQHQLAQFTMLGSVTTSLGRTVNQFLRGQ